MISSAQIIEIKSRRESHETIEDIALEMNLSTSTVKRHIMPGNKGKSNRPRKTPTKSPRGSTPEPARGRYAGMPKRATGRMS